MARQWIVKGGSAEQWLMERGAGDLAQQFYVECAQHAGAWNDFQDGGLVPYTDVHKETVGQITQWMTKHGHGLSEAEGIDLLEHLRTDLVAV